MLYSKKESLEDIIVRILIPNSLSVKNINQLVFRLGKKVTPQGIYKALNSLISDEIIIKNGFLYSVSKEWQSRVSSAFSTHSGLLDLEEGETIHMDLTSLIHLDQQWKNIMIPLHETYPDYPVFIYNPHDIWKHLSPSRWNSEQEYYDTFSENHTQLFLSLGNNTIHEQETKKLRKNKFIQVSIGKSHFKETDHPVIFGDYIITTRLSTATTQKTKEVFAQAKNSRELSQMIPVIGIEKKKVKLVIERNKERAKSLRKKLSADFHVPRELVEKFDLF